ncbi:MAG: hypothetical protein MOGMAGMI_00168 [Candidatus Omnitrophica bacterium]|nr:hypothetical protein [Candidatus Omnitrophota bacterium]
MSLERRSSRALVLALLIFLLEIAAVVVLTTAPLQGLIGPGLLGARSALHALFAGIVMITMTIGVFQGIRLWTSEMPRIEDLEAGSLVNVIACLAALVSGAVLLTARRPDLAAPPALRVFFEFKQFAGMLCLPLVVAACSIIWRYGEALPRSRAVRETAGLVLMLAFFYFMCAFALGAALARLRTLQGVL